MVNCELQNSKAILLADHNVKLAVQEYPQDNSEDTKIDSTRKFSREADSVTGLQHQTLLVIIRLFSSFERSGERG